MAGATVLQMLRNALRIAADEDDDSPQSRTVDLQVGRTVHTVSGSMRTELWLSVLTCNRGAGHAAAREYAQMLARVRPWPVQRLHCRAAFARRQVCNWAALLMQVSAFDCGFRAISSALRQCLSRTAKPALERRTTLLPRAGRKRGPDGHLAVLSKAAVLRARHGLRWSMTPLKRTWGARSRASSGTPAAQPSPMLRAHKCQAAAAYACVRGLRCSAPARISALRQPPQGGDQGTPRAQVHNASGTGQPGARAQGVCCRRPRGQLLPGTCPGHAWFEFSFAKVCNSGWLSRACRPGVRGCALRVSWKSNCCKLISGKATAGNGRVGISAVVWGLSSGLRCLGVYKCGAARALAKQGTPQSGQHGEINACLRCRWCRKAGDVCGGGGFLDSLCQAGELAEH